MAATLQGLREDCFAATRARLTQALTADQLIIHATNAVHDLHRTTNMLAKRLREWSGGWQPELERSMKDHEEFAKQLADGRPSRSDGIGTPIRKEDQEAIIGFAKRLLTLYSERDRLMRYIEAQLKAIMPNTLALCGGGIAADLLASAGSLERLATMPSGTIQLLGAETALFRHLKNKRHRPPKHGIIFNHQLLQGTKKADRGKAARALADKIAIAVKVDRFKGEPCGERLRKGLEQRFGGRK